MLCSKAVYCPSPHAQHYHLLPKFRFCWPAMEKYVVLSFLLYKNIVFSWGNFRAFSYSPLLKFMMLFLGWLTLYNLENGILTYWEHLLCFFFFLSCFSIFTYYIYRNDSLHVFPFPSSTSFVFYFYMIINMGYFSQLYILIHLTKLLILAFIKVVSEEFLAICSLFIVSFISWISFSIEEIQESFILHYLHSEFISSCFGYVDLLQSRLSPVGL
jgi:hypothetical protein